VGARSQPRKHADAACTSCEKSRRPEAAIRKQYERSLSQVRRNSEYRISSRMAVVAVLLMAGTSFRGTGKRSERQRPACWSPAARRPRSPASCMTTMWCSEYHLAGRRLQALATESSPRQWRELRLANPDGYSVILRNSTINRSVPCGPRVYRAGDRRCRENSIRVRSARSLSRSGTRPKQEKVYFDTMVTVFQATRYNERLEGRSFRRRALGEDT